MFTQIPRAVLLVSRDQKWRGRLIECVSELGLKHSAVTPDKLRRARRGIVTCLDPRSMLELQSACPPSVVVIVHARILDDALVFVNDAGVAVIGIAALSPLKFLDAMIRATLGVSTRGLEQYLASSSLLRAVPLPVIEAFLRAPTRMTRLIDLCRALRVSQDAARAMVRDTGFRRAEHLLAALRAEAWRWFAAQGLNRTVFEEYLGIRDRHDFKRACRRAGFQVPWFSAS